MYSCVYRCKPKKHKRQKNTKRPSQNTEAQKHRTVHLPHILSLSPLSLFFEGRGERGEGRGERGEGSGERGCILSVSSSHRQLTCSRFDNIQKGKQSPSLVLAEETGRGEEAVMGKGCTHVHMHKCRDIHMHIACTGGGEKEEEGEEGGRGRRNNITARKDREI